MCYIETENFSMIRFSQYGNFFWFYWAFDVFGFKREYLINSKNIISRSETQIMHLPKYVKLYEIQSEIDDFLHFYHIFDSMMLSNTFINRICWIIRRRCAKFELQDF
jgi:hypothetical protein